MKFTAPTLAPRLATASTIRNIEIAVKNAPATGLLKWRVTTTVRPIVATAETAAPTRFRAPPRATPASPAWVPPRPPGASDAAV